MSSIRLADLSIFSEKELNALAQNGIITTQHLLCVSGSRLRYILDTETVASALELVRKVIFKTNIVSEDDIKNPKTALSLLQQHNAEKLFLPLQYIPTFNELFHGGLSLNSITEIVGQSSSGKTEFCLTVACDLLLGNYDFGCVIFDTEQKHTYILSRILEILKKRNPEMTDTEIDDRVTNRCTILDITSSKELIENLDDMEEFIFEKNIKLLIIDSLGTLASKEFMGKEGGIFERASALQTEATLLKQLNEKFKVGVIVTNTLSQESEHAHLGVNWFHFVNHRLKISKIEETKLILSVQKSAVVSNSSISLCTDRVGLREISQPLEQE
ncbi:hypothetical protein C9374_000842 [Naegleria lovaniensis]|uniref:RecA family profile 1 domain-containing protein n=1 Tax=Naegleria lovaniensis TaxID=51637 RepID=A0AA88GVV9_NAELO|nr:uncharacterized protein C9374_000842 [Naegleria lovaniensis]KAG2387992.1 hypothetical protein C9374_000842 [Naegleria lovaniensis]